MKRRLLNVLTALSLAAFLATAQVWAASPWGFCLCPVCGYDLRATAERCPECGTQAAAGAEA